MNIKIPAFLLLTVLAIQAQAGTCTTNYCDGKITSLQIHPNTKVYVKMDADMSALSCALDNNAIALHKSHEMHDETYQALLATSMSDWTIRVRATDNGSCEVVYVQIIR